MTRPLRWFITGVRRGLGRAIAEAALARGDLVVGAVRRPEDRGSIADLAPGRVWAASCDVRRSDEVGRAVEAAVSVMGGIDVVVNNAGYGLFGAVEEVGEAELRAQMEVNVYGAWNVVRAVLPTLRAQGEGHIVQMSSIAGLVASQGAGAYNASKFALEGMSEALALELRPFGIHVTLVEPGQFRTDFAGDSARVAMNGIEGYANGAAGQRRRLTNMDHKQPGDPARAAAAIMALVDMPAPPVRLVLGKDAVRRARTRLRWVAAEVAASERLVEDTWFPDAAPDAGLPDFVPPTRVRRAASKRTRM
jgi:NAD(P)-dependent dehydrogenase (short-subunit alcohol dehydrogenase family)